MRKNITAIFFTAVMFIICVFIFGAINGISIFSPEAKYGIPYQEGSVKTKDFSKSQKIYQDDQDTNSATEKSETDTISSQEETADVETNLGSSALATRVTAQGEQIEIDSALDSENLEYSNYIERLDNIKAAYHNKWDSLTDSDMTSMKNLQQQEHDKWDEELNIIYNKIKKDLPENTFKEIRDEERQWIKLRDERAAKAASKYQGGSLESLEYTAKLTDITIERTYELVDIYFNLK